jgi:cyclic pyranopterin phosphate synthase
MSDEKALRMIDVSGKEITRRTATATASVKMKPEVLSLLLEGKLPKGDALQVARVAAILAAKEAPRLIPMCHTIPVEHVDIDFRPAPPDTVRIVTTVTATAKTGAEMEALVAAATAALNIYDMCKAVDREIVIGELKLLRKTGGKSGDFVAGSAE